jgi:hypothetical protein
MDRLDFTVSGSEQLCLAIIELPTAVDSRLHQFMFGLLLKVVSEVYEMGLFHQLGYANRESGLQQSTASSERSLTEAPEEAGREPPTDKKGRKKTNDCSLPLVQDPMPVIIEQVGCALN